MSSLVRFRNLLRQSKVDGLTRFRDVNQESVYIVSVTVAH
jgi:hypothetical protein